MGRKYKEIEKLSENARKEKLEELKMELIRKSITANRAGKGKAKEIKKAIARILTRNNQKNKGHHTSEGVA